MGSITLIAQLIWAHLDKQFKTNDASNSSHRVHTQPYRVINNPVKECPLGSTKDTTSGPWTATQPDTAVS